MTTYIYALKDPITFEIRYIGKSDNPIKRLRKHIIFTKANPNCYNHKTNWIRQIISTNSIPIIEIIDEVNIVDWMFWESHYISLYKSWGFNLVNSTLGGDGGATRNGRKNSVEHCLKMSLSQKGRKLTEEHRKKIAEAAKSRKKRAPLSEETKKKMSASAKNTYSNGRIPPFTGKKFTEEHKKNLSNSVKKAKRKN